MKENFPGSHENVIDLAQAAAEMVQLQAAAHASGDLVLGDGGDFQYALAPNGERSRLDESHWLFTRTEAFKSWFGDWQNDPENASKIVDANGEPLLVWQESPHDYDVHDDEKIASTNDHGYYGRGHYFFSQRNTYTLGFYAGTGDIAEYACFVNAPSVFREDKAELVELTRYLYGYSDREGAIEQGVKVIAPYKIGYTEADVAALYDEASTCEARVVGSEYEEPGLPIEAMLREIVVKEAKNVFIADKIYNETRHVSRIPQAGEVR